VPRVLLRTRLRVPSRTGLQLPRTVAVRTTVGTGVELATRLGFGETRTLTLAVKLQIAGRIRPALTSRFDRTIAFQVAFRTTPGTVLGTVPTVTPRMSFWAALVASNATSFGHLGRLRTTQPRQVSSCIWLAPETASPLPLSFSEHGRIQCSVGRPTSPALFAAVLDSSFGQPIIPYGIRTPDIDTNAKERGASEHPTLDED
jgi:hypothetical protein